MPYLWFSHVSWMSSHIEWLLKRLLSNNFSFQPNHLKISIGCCVFQAIYEATVFIMHKGICKSDVDLYQHDLCWFSCDCWQHSIPPLLYLVVYAFIALPSHIYLHPLTYLVSGKVTPFQPSNINRTDQRSRREILASTCLGTWQNLCMVI